MAVSGATQPLSFEIVYIAELPDNTRLIRCNIKYFESHVLSLRPTGWEGGKTAEVPVAALLISTI